MTAPPPTHDAYAADLVPLAARLIGAVRYEGHAATRAVFNELRTRPHPAGVHPAEALAVILAAMVDDNRTALELLAWVDTTHITDHALGTVTPREANRIRAACNRAGKPIPDYIRGPYATYRAQRRNARRNEPADPVHSPQSPVDGPVDAARDHDAA